MLRIQIVIMCICTFNKLLLLLLFHLVTTHANTFVEQYFSSITASVPHSAH